MAAFDSTAFDIQSFAGASFDFGGDGTVAVIGGDAARGLTRSHIHAGGKFILIGVSEDTWVSSGAAFDAQRQNIIDGLDSDGSESTGWNTVVRDALSVTDVV